MTAVKFAVTIFSVLIGTISIAPAAEFLTQTFRIKAPCDKQEIVHRISINDAAPGDGSAQSEGWKIKPWIDAPIKIRFAHILKIGGGAHSWLMVGSNTSGDAMVFLDANQHSEKWLYPAGTYKSFPASSAAKPQQYMDLHGSCDGAESLTAFVTFGYTQEP